MTIDERLKALKQSVELHHREMQEARLQMNETDLRFDQLGQFVHQVPMACASLSLSIKSQ